ncbi:tRNA (adenosine(37)-N6)-dimethylallyltransferase MiaA [Asticcacaulis solisilvae]|uniref:tRNA (adenosine(37)-N6)-dimethylallyltransferase MiaA n=1 Tax=Asticcacaulis solisilvae TaxID=1217274 RepID=UPI003FD76DAD
MSLSASNAPIRLLAGPTASGKSALALDWAERTGGIILNADSMQLYADVPILTARPSRDDEARAQHVLYGHLPPEATWSAGEWVRAAKPFLDAALAGGAPVCVTGGTGLYFNSLVHGLAEIPEIGGAARSEARGDFDRLGEEAFRKNLKQVDPRAEARIAANDRQRLCRAWEVWLETGRSLSGWQDDTTPVLPDNSYHLEILTPDRAWLYERCDRRFDLMISGGALEEVRALMARGLEEDWPVMRVLGLKESVDYLEGRVALAEATALAQQKTRNYAKRQMTWFRNQFGGRSGTPL